MVKKAFIRANIPFVIHEEMTFGNEFIQSATGHGWTKREIQGDLLLKHINTSFANNFVCFSKKCDGLNLVVPMIDAKTSSVKALYSITVSEVQVYCFDTEIGICSLLISYDQDTDEDAIANCCSLLHCSVPHSDKKQCKPILQDEKETYLSCIADHFIGSLLGSAYTLFGTSNQTQLRRINMFSAALCNQEAAADEGAVCNNLCYRLANSYDARDKSLAVSKQDLHHQHHYIRWSFSKRGCAVVANLTGNAENDHFLQNRWFFSVSSNYFYIYLMVLHEKLAIYHYLNSIAEDPDMEHLKINQKSLIDFNNKYIFSIVSDEPFIQSAYLQLKQAANADDTYAELQEQLKRMFDYAQFQAAEAAEKKNDRFNLISIILGIAGFISIALDTVNFFTGLGFSIGFQSRGNSIYTAALSLEALLLLLVPCCLFGRNKKRK